LTFRARWPSHSSRLGRRQSATVDPRRQIPRFSLPPRTFYLGTIASTLSPLTAASLRLFRCPSQAPAISRPMTELSTPRSSRIFAPGKSIFRWLGPAALIIQSESHAGKNHRRTSARPSRSMWNRRKNFLSPRIRTTNRLTLYSYYVKTEEPTTHPQYQVGTCAKERQGGGLGRAGFPTAITISISFIILCNRTFRLSVRPVQVNSSLCLPMLLPSPPRRCPPPATSNP